MYIRDYKYLTSTVDCGDHLEIEGISRDGYVTDQYINKIPQIVLDRKTAVLYAPGVSVSQSESRDPAGINDKFKGSVPLGVAGPLVKELTMYGLHRWVGSMVNNEFVTYASVNGNTCASSMYAMFEAEMLLKAGVVDEVVVIAEERTSYNTIRIFKEHSVDVRVSDGFAVVRFVREPVGFEVSKCKWGFEWNRNPFAVSKSGYLKVVSEHDVVKGHGTGTGVNNEAETVFGDVVEYKSQIGHCQGASALVELCMAIDDSKLNGDVLCVASGLGNVYGSCVLSKR